MRQRRLFCECGPVCYAISLQKEYLLRWLRDLQGNERFAGEQSTEPLAQIVKAHRSVLLRRLAGVDLQLQRNKAQNLRLAGAGMDGLLIRPHETFSFWRRVGKPTAEKGYLEGLVIIGGGKPSAAVGGGLCQLANLIHWLVLQSPLTVTELHHHTDALFPDDHRRVPFGTGTSVFYNNVDYRFCNDTEDTYQLRIWLEGDDLCGELRCDAELPVRYRIIERDHHYRREEDGFYRVSEIWKRMTDRETGETVSEQLIFKNHSKVLIDEALIPVDQIR